MKKILIMFISFIMLVATVSAVPFSIDYSYVNTDYGIEYLNVQYGNYYDNVNLKVKLKVEDLPQNYSYIPVVVSPKIYGITNTGSLNYLYSVPSTTYYLSGATEYYYPNLFYLTPEYNGYVVSVNAWYGSNYSTSNIAYVYPVGSSPAAYFYPVESQEHQGSNSQNTIASCESFYLSGQREIYFEEDEQKNYNLYIENDSSSDLRILSVTANNYQKLDLRNIDYPDTVLGNYVGTVNLRLKADSVSSDYDSSFNINVVGRYGSGNECQKTYNVSYHIKDKDSENNASCSEIQIRDTSFTINDNQTTRKIISLENRTYDYDYEIDRITIKNKTNISARIISKPTVVYSDSTAYLEVEFDTDNLNYTTVRYLDLEINGRLTKANRTDKTCNKKENLVITIVDTGSNTHTSQVSKNCKDIKIYAGNISQERNITRSYSEENGFFIVNNSNLPFTINNLSINSSSNKTQIKNIKYNNYINPGSKKVSINFDLETKNVYSTETTKGTIYVSGNFIDGTSCSFSEIGYQQFDIKVLDSDYSVCSEVGVYDKEVTEGYNYIQAFNNTNKKFFVTNVLFQEKKGLNLNVSNSQITINPNTSSTMQVGVSGNGKAEMLVSGYFEDGKSCSFTQTKTGQLKTRDSDLQFSDNFCDFDLEIPNIITINNASEYFNINFKNNSSRGGKIVLSGSGLVVDPNEIYLSGWDNFTKEIKISNFSNPRIIYFDVQLNSCSSKRYYTTVNSNYTDNSKINLVSYPSLLVPKTNALSISLVVNNDFSIAKYIKIKVTGLPENFRIPEKNIELLAQEKKEVSLNLNIPENAEKISYNGYIELYTNNDLISKYPITIDLREEDEAVTLSYVLENKSKIYYLKLELENKTSLYQDITLDFDLDDSFVIEGDKDVSLKPNEKITKEYRIVSSQLIKEDKQFDIKIKDRDTEKILAKEEILFKKNYSTITGFLTLNRFGIVVLGIFVLLILFFIFKKK